MHNILKFNISLQKTLILVTVISLCFNVNLLNRYDDYFVYILLLILAFFQIMLIIKSDNIIMFTISILMFMGYSFPALSYPYLQTTWLFNSSKLSSVFSIELLLYASLTATILTLSFFFFLKYLIIKKHTLLNQ
jgi:hypothetical protein